MAYRTTGKISAHCAAGLGAALFSAVAMAQPLPDLHGKSLAFAGWGGDTQKYQDEAWLKPFAKATGVKIDQTDTPTVAALKTQQEANNVGIDVMQIDSSIVDGGCGTVFQEAKIDRSQLDPALDRNKCGVPVVKFSYVRAYNSAKFKIAPTKVADFFDVEIHGIGKGHHAAGIHVQRFATLQFTFDNRATGVNEYHAIAFQLLHDESFTTK